MQGSMKRQLDGGRPASTSNLHRGMRSPTFDAMVDVSSPQPLPGSRATSTQAYSSRARSQSPPRRDVEPPPPSRMLGASASASSLARTPSSTGFHPPRRGCERYSNTATQMEMRLEAAVQSKKQQDLELALQDAEAVGLSVEKLAPAQQALAILVSKQEVRKAVAAEQRALAKLAQAAGTPPPHQGPYMELPDKSQWAACSQAVEAGLEAQALCRAAGLKHSERKLVKATKTVLDPLRKAVWPKLVALVQARDIPALHSLLQACSAARLDEVRNWRITLEKAQMMCEAKPQLEAALQQGTAQALIPAIDKARTAGLRPVDIIPAEQALAAVERKTAMKWSLLAAMLGTSAPLLRLTIDASEALGTPHRRLEEPLQLLGVLEELFEVAVGICHALRQGAKHGDGSRIRKALDMAERLGAERDPMCKELMTLGKKELSRLTRRHSARTQLWDTAASRKTVVISRMPKAIKKGEAAGLKEEEIEAASTVYTKAVAEKSLEKALQSKDIDALRQAIKDGMRAKLSPQTIREAMRTLKEEELLRSLRDLISRSTNINNLEKGIDALVTSGPNANDPSQYESGPFREIRARVLHMKNQMLVADSILKEPIVFDLESVELPMSELPKMHGKIKVLKQHPTAHVRIEAFSTHSNGAVAHKMSVDRAASVVDVFRRAGCTNSMSTRPVGSPKVDKLKREVVVVADVMGMGAQIRAQLLKGIDDLDSFDEQTYSSVPLYRLRKGTQ